MQCLSNLKQMANAQEMYASQFNGWAVPIFIGKKTAAPNQRLFWQNNHQFRANLNLPTAGPGSTKYNNRWTPGMICPEASQAFSRENTEGVPVQLSYGYNVLAPKKNGGKVKILPGPDQDPDSYFKGRKKTGVIVAVAEADVGRFPRREPQPQQVLQARRGARVRRDQGRGRGGVRRTTATAARRKTRPTSRSGTGTSRRWSAARSRPRPTRTCRWFSLWHPDRDK